MIGPPRWFDPVTEAPQTNALSTELNRPPARLCYTALPVTVWVDANRPWIRKNDNFSMIIRSTQANLPTSNCNGVHQSFWKPTKTGWDRYTSPIARHKRHGQTRYGINRLEPKRVYTTSKAFVAPESLIILLWHTSATWTIRSANMRVGAVIWLDTIYWVCMCLWSEGTYTYILAGMWRVTLYSWAGLLPLSLLARRHDTCAPY